MFDPANCLFWSQFYQLYIIFSLFSLILYGGCILNENILNVNNYCWIIDWKRNWNRIEENAMHLILIRPRNAMYNVHCHCYLAMLHLLQKTYQVVAWLDSTTDFIYSTCCTSTDPSNYWTGVLQCTLSRNEGLDKYY